jgi:hypothetical protein
MQKESNLRPEVPSWTIGWYRNVEELCTPLHPADTFEHEPARSVADRVA